MVGRGQVMAKAAREKICGDASQITARRMKLMKMRLKLACLHAVFFRESSMYLVHAVWSCLSWCLLREPPPNSH